MISSSALLVVAARFWREYKLLIDEIARVTHTLRHE